MSAFSPRLSRTVARLALLASGLAPLSALHAQKVVVSHDEWLGNNSYLTNATDGKAGEFIANTLSWFGVTSGKSVLLYSNNGVFTGSNLQAELSALGLTVTQNASAASFAGYDAVFVGGNPSMNAAGLVSYVQGGGNVLYYGGTGTNGSANEAAYSNPFLNAFGFGFVVNNATGDGYNAINTVNVATNGFATQAPYGAMLFSNVATIGGQNGSELVTTALPAGVTRQMFADVADHGGRYVYGVADVGVTAAPEPASYLLMGSGLLALGAVVRRRRSA